MIDKAHLEILLRAILAASVAMLEEGGDFVPLAATIDGGGVVEFLTSLEDDDEPVEQNKVIASLTAKLKESAEAGSIQASALAFDASIHDEGEAEARDAIVVRLRAAELARDIITPYELRTSGFFRKKTEVSVDRGRTQSGNQDVFG